MQSSDVEMMSHNYSYGWRLLVVGFLIVGTSFLTPSTSGRDIISDTYIGTYCIDTALIASVIFGECSICPVSEQYKTGSVIINRWKSGKYGATIKDVIYADKQFHAVHPDSSLRYDRVHYNIARELLRGEKLSSHIRYFSKNVRFFKRYKLDIWYKEKYHYFGV